jgi:hypothetical protein
MKLSNNKKSIVKAAVFLINFLLLYVLVNAVFKDKSFSMDDEFSFLEKNPRDVIFIGSSHVNTAIIPAIIWQESGITSFNLTGNGLLIWTEYHYIKEILKYQKPKVIACELYTMVVEDEYAYASFIFQHISIMKFSKNRVAAIRAAVPKDAWIDYVLGFPVYHNKIDFSIDDFKYLFGINPSSVIYLYFNGYYPRYGWHWPNDTPKKPDISSFSGYGEIPPKTLLYLMKIIELAKEHKDIKFLFFVTPYAVDKKDAEIFNSIGKIAKENNIEFINYHLLYDEIKLDFDADSLNPTHINEKGAMKVSKDLAKRLSKLYDLKDNRKNPDYEFWNTRSKEAIQKIKDDSARFYEENK